MIRRFALAVVLTLILAAEFSAGQDIKVAAAADLQSAMQDVVGRFQEQTGKTVRVTYGS